MAFTNNADCPTIFSFDGCPSTYKFLINHTLLGSLIIAVPKRFSNFHFMKVFYIVCETK